MEKGMKQETIRYNLKKQPAGYYLIMMSLLLFIGFIESVLGDFGLSALMVLGASISLFFMGRMFVELPTKCVFSENRLIVRNYWFRQEIPKEAIEQIYLNEDSVQIWWRPSEKDALKRVSLPIESAEHFAVFSRHLPLLTLETPDLPLTLWVRWYWVFGLVPILLYLGVRLFDMYRSLGAWQPLVAALLIIGMALFWYLQRLIWHVTFDETHIEVVYLWRKKRFKRSLLSHVVLTPFTSIARLPLFTNKQLELYFHGEVEPIVLSARFLIYDNLPVTANFGYLPEYLAHHYQVPLQVEGPQD